MTKNRTRDPVTGQYAYFDNFDRMCRCGHTLGNHVHGGSECVNHDTGDGQHCGCVEFRPVFDKTDVNGMKPTCESGK